MYIDANPHSWLMIILNGTLELRILLVLKPLMSSSEGQ